MGYPTKIATCCYCMSKTVLRLEMGQHQLSCASCGAPLRDLKMMPKETSRRSAVTHQQPIYGLTKDAKPKPAKKKKAVKRRKRRSWLKDWAEEACDFVEDIFD